MAIASRFNRSAVGRFLDSRAGRVFRLAGGAAFVALWRAPLTQARRNRCSAWPRSSGGRSPSRPARSTSATSASSSAAPFAGPACRSEAARATKRA